MQKIKWFKEYPNLRGLVDGFEVLIWTSQYGTYTNTKRYEWKVIQNGEPVRFGSETSQARAKFLAQAYVDGMKAGDQ